MELFVRPNSSYRIDKGSIKLVDKMKIEYPPCDIFPFLFQAYFKHDASKESKQNAKFSRLVAVSFTIQRSRERRRGNRGKSVFVSLLKAAAAGKRYPCRGAWFSAEFVSTRRKQNFPTSHSVVSGNQNSPAMVFLSVRQPFRRFASATAAVARSPSRVQ